MPTELFNDAMRYLENPNLENILLNGPPGSNRHTINNDNAQLWIDSQTSTKRKIAAETIIKTARYIPHSEFISKMEKLVTNVYKRVIKNKYNNNELILVSEKKTKSGFYCSMIFMFIVKNKIINRELIPGTELEYFYPKDMIVGFNTRSVNEIYLDSPNNYVSVNDMDYTGNQFYNSLNTFRSKVSLQLDNKNLFIRAGVFNTQISKNKLYKLKTEVPDLYGGIKFESIVIETIKTFAQSVKTQFKDDHWRERLSYSLVFFGSCDIGATPTVTNVYLDHKVADIPSSIALSYTFGIVPNVADYKDLGDYNFNCLNTQILTFNEYIKLITKEDNEDKDIIPLNVIPVVNGCSYRHINSFTRNPEVQNNSIMANELLHEEYENLRCPFAWYKKLDYETGLINLNDTRNIIQDAGSSTYDYIINPKSGRKVKINSKLGRTILSKYSSI